MTIITNPFAQEWCVYRIHFVSVCSWHPIRWRDIPRSSKLTVEKSSSDVKKMETDVVFHCCCVVNDLFSLLPCA